MPFYIWNRSLHLYVGLFLSPFVVVFALSVFFLNHAHVPEKPPEPRVSVHQVRIPEGVERAEGRERLALAAEIISQVGVTGEINFISYSAKRHRLVIPVVKPGVETTVDVNVETGSAKVSQRRTGVWEALVYLHKSPGPHNVAIRGNWFWTRLWKWLADATVLGLLFLSANGIYLWTVLRAERKMGLVMLGTGAASFVGIIYALIA